MTVFRIPDDEREKKIRVEIKPLSNGSGPMSASVDELRATVENLSLSPIGAIPVSVVRIRIQSQYIFPKVFMIIIV